MSPLCRHGTPFVHEQGTHLQPWMTTGVPAPVQAVSGPSTPQRMMAPYSGGR
jgi:hypothetical protein